jgi:hypothetical protein
MSIVGFSGQSPRFSPLDIPGCTLWLDAADTRTLTLTGSNVTQWNDKSPRAYHATGYGATTLGAFTSGTTGITLNGSTTYFYASNATAMNTTTALSAFVVATMNTMGAPGFQRLLSFGDPDWSGTANCVAFDKFGDSTPKITFERGGYPTPSLSFTAPFNFVGCTVFSSTGASQFINGTSNASVSGTYGAFNYALYNVGRYSGGGPYNWNGMICEVVVYNTEITTTQRQAVEGYLARKWGLLGSLPSNHPSRTELIPMRSFSPADVNGCTLWLDAADSTTITLSGSTVTQWADKSGNGNNARPFGSGPTRGVNAVTFSGTQTMDGSATYLHNSSNGTWSIFSAFRPASLAGDPRLLHYQGTPNRVAQFLYVEGGTLTTLAWLSGEASLVQAFGGSLASNTSYVASAVNTTTTLTAYRNGTAGSPVSHDALTTISNGRYILGGLSATENRLAGDVYELLVYSSALSEAQRQQVEGYLGIKWGLLSQFPSTHGMRYALPLTPVFTPLQIPGCTLWLDAVDTGTQTFSGSNLTQWTDKSGMGYTMNTIPNGCVAPVQGNAINGRPTIGITNTSMSIKQASNVIDGIKNIFWVRRERTGNQGYEFYFGSDGAYDFHTGPTTYADVNFAQQGIRDASLSLFLSNGVTTGTMVGTNMPGGGSVNILSVSNMTGTTRVQGLSYDRNGGTRSMQCDWGEVLLYTTAVPAADIKRIEGYLAWKWGLVSYLPSNHPFKLVKP